MSGLVERLRAFEGSDALGNGDFSVCIEAAALIEQLVEALEEAVCLVPASQKTALAKFNTALSAARGEDGKPSEFPPGFDRPTPPSGGRVA